MCNKINTNLKLCLNISNLSDTTKDRYSYCITKYITFVEEKGKNIDINSVREFLNYLKETKKRCIGTVNDYRSAIKYLFEVVLDIGWNDRKIPRLKGYKPLPVCLSINEVKKLLNSTKNILYYTIFSTMYSSGLRISEVVNLRFSDIDKERDLIYIRKSKSGSARNAILSDRNLKILRLYYKKYWHKKFGKCDKEDYIFCTYRTDAPIAKRSVRKEMKNSAERARIDKKLTPHSLRHSVAVHMIESGVSLIAIQHVLGHKSILSTCIYLQLANIKKLGCKSPFDTQF